ncbi:hypothetical protein [Aeromonas phage 62AhydR11PP]|nr:hypothetical protein [Aeromonas phage 62AhydR11PP]
MSNETDLDWLARNVHVWAPNELIRMKPCDNGNGKFRASWCYSGDGGFTKDQWLTHRAELQNKPSWKDAPEWANYLAIDGDSVWYWHEMDPKTVAGCEYWMSRGQSGIACRGEVLGDWRDTMERRSEEFKPSIEEANRLAQEFKQFTSIEDSQEKEMKRDNGWFERGELPPAGIECEAYVDGRWQECYVVGFSRIGDPVIEVNRSITDVNRCKFRPIRTERDVLLSIIVEEMNRYDTDGKLADAILAAGFSLRGK